MQCSLTINASQLSMNKESLSRGGIYLLYNLLFPLFLCIALPGYLLKTKRRGGFGTGMRERFGIYRTPQNKEPQNGILIQAVSVGEVMIALKLIHAWQKVSKLPVILASTSATGHALAKKEAPENVRVIYSPLDLPFLSGICLRRFKPQAIVLIEAELWPNFAKAANKQNCPIIMVNARLSAKSEAQYTQFPLISRWFYSWLSSMGVQDARDAQRFEKIGVDPRIIHITGSIKYDQDNAINIPIREDFQAILQTISQGTSIVLAASTHDGEELLIAEAIHQAGGVPLIVPRHAERRHKILTELTNAGWQCSLRSEHNALPSSFLPKYCYISDTTGELRSWTALADLVVIGKSFYGYGGQNPAEAVACSVPVITGPHMENFDTLMDILQQAKGIMAVEENTLADTIASFLKNPSRAQEQAQRATEAIEAHSGATMRSIQLILSYIQA